MSKQKQIHTNEFKEDAVEWQFAGRLPAARGPVEVDQLARAAEAEGWMARLDQRAFGLNRIGQLFSGHSSSILRLRLYCQRSGIEGTVSQAVHGMGIRLSRYRGLARTHLQHVATAATINLTRVVDWLSGKRPKTAHCSSFATLAMQC